jgi:predicted glycosyltransferase
VTATVLFYVQYLLGIGHVQRSLRIAEALTQAGLRVTLVQGGPPLPDLGPAGAIDIVQLPPIRARDATFALVDGAGNPVGEALRGERRALLLATFERLRPAAVIIEGFPFARRAFRFELDPLIAAVRTARPRPRLVCSVRDIPTVRGDAARQSEIVARVNGDFAAVLVHGDPGFIPFEVPFPAAAQIAERLFYTGYVASPAAAPAAAGLPVGEVLVSVGGGAGGRLLLEAALTARQLGCCAERGWRVLAGSAMSEAGLAGLRQAAPAGVEIERFRPDFAALLRNCHVSVSQAGYNTVLDILAAGARAVLVPFAAERETEQQIRAERLAACGVAELVRESDLSPAHLAAAIDRAAGRSPAGLVLDTAGAARSAQLVAAIIAGKVPQAFSTGAATV